MYTLLQGHRARGDSGEPVPAAFASLEAAGTNLIRGQLSLWVSAAGVGKSSLILTQALRPQLPVLYFSADSDAAIQTSRSMSILTGADLAQSREWARTGSWPQEVTERLSNPFFRWNFSASPSLDSLEFAVECYDEIYGEYPHLIIVDNITNVRGTGEGNADDPFSGLESLMDYLNTMARATGAHVAGLHHTTASYNSADTPIPMSGVKGQISRVPAMIVTLHRRDDGLGGTEICVSTVKNRDGKSDPSGLDFVPLDFNATSMSITDKKGGDALFP